MRLVRRSAEAVFLSLLVCCTFIATISAKRVTGGLKPKPLDAAGAMCKPCIVGMDQSAEDLLGLLSAPATRAAITSCSGLCGRLVSPLVKEMCIAVCNVHGLEGFEERLKAHGHDSLELCLSLTSCVTNPQAAGRVRNIDITPRQVPLDGEITVRVNYRVEQPVTAGQMVFTFSSQDTTIEDYKVVIRQKQAGVFDEEISVQISTGVYLPQQYQLTVSLCEGSCQSKEYSKQLDSKSTVFEVQTPCETPQT